MVCKRPADTYGLSRQVYVYVQTNRQNRQANIQTDSEVARLLDSQIDRKIDRHKKGYIYIYMHILTYLFIFMCMNMYTRVLIA